MVKIFGARATALAVASSASLTLAHMTRSGAITRQAHAAPALDESPTPYRTLKRWNKRASSFRRDLKFAARNALDAHRNRAQACRSPVDTIRDGLKTQTGEDVLALGAKLGEFQFRKRTGWSALGGVG